MWFIGIWIGGKFMFNGNINEILAQELFQRLRDKDCLSFKGEEIQEIIADFFGVPKEKLEWIW